MKTIFLISGIRFTYKFVIHILKEDKRVFLEFLKYWPSSHSSNKLGNGAAVSSDGERSFLFPYPRFFFLCFVYQWLSLCPLGFVLKFSPLFKTSTWSFLPLSISFLSFRSLSSSFPPPCQRCSSLSAAASWRCWWWRPGEWLGRWSAPFFFLFSVFFFFSPVLLCSVSSFCFSRCCCLLGGQCFATIFSST